MRKFAVMLLVILFTAQAFGGFNLEWKEYEQTEKKLVEITPDIVSMAYDRPDDLDMHLGLGFLCYYYRCDTSDRLPEDDVLSISNAIGLDRVLELDPNNKAVLALQCYRRFQYYSDSEAWTSLSRLKMEIDTARRYGFTDRSFEKGTWLFDFFKQVVDIKGKGLRVSPRYYEGDRKTRKYYMAVIKEEEYDEALNKVREYIVREETKPLIKEIDTYAKNDPGNALYDYLKANIYFSVGKMQKGLNEVRKGSKKNHINTYVQERHDAMVYVLEQFPFTENEIESILDISIPMESNFIGRRIWGEGLKILSANYENKGEYKKTQEIYELLAKAADQCQLDQPKSHGLSSWAKERIEKVKKKMEGEQELRKEKKI